MMKYIIFLICFYDWLYKDYTNALLEEEKVKDYFEKNIKIDTISNPFYNFKRAMELEKRGLFFESIQKLKKAIDLSNDKISYLARFYIVSISKNIKSFEEEIKKRILFLKEKNEWEGIYFLSSYLLLLSKNATTPEYKEFLLRESILFSPDFYPSYIELIKIHLEELNFYKFFEDFSEFIGLIFKSSFLRKFLFLFFIKFSFLLFYYFIIFFSLGKIISFSGYETSYFKNFMRESFPFLLILEIILILLNIPAPFHLFLLLPLYFFFTQKERIIFLFLNLILISIFYFGKLERNFEKYYSKENYPLFFKKFKNIPFSKKVFEILKEENSFEANLKGILIFKGKGVDSALYYFKRILKIYPDDPYIILNIGNLYYLKKSYDSAYIYYKRSLKKNPLIYEAHFNLAQVGFKKFDLYSYESEIKKSQEINYSEVIKKTYRIKEYEALEFFWGIHDLPEKNIYIKGEIEKLYFFPFSGIFSFLLFLFSIFFFKNKKKALKCPACFKFSNEILKIEPNFEVCRDCLEKLQKTDSFKIRERIFNKIRVDSLFRKRLIILILNLFLPSCGFLYSGSHFLFFISFIFLFIGFYFSIILKINLLWIIFYLIYLVIFIFPYYYFKEVKIGTSG